MKREGGVLHAVLDLAMADTTCRSVEFLQEQKSELCALLLDDMKQAFWVPNWEVRAAAFMEGLWPIMLRQTRQDRDRYIS